jgi:hypothetical protein
MQWHCALGLLLQWLGPARTERARPISAFWPEGEDRGFNPPLYWRGPADQFRPTGVTHRTRWCRGETLDQGKPMGCSRVEGGSPQRSSGGEERRRWVDDDDGSDWRFFLKWWRGRRCSDSSGRWWPARKKKAVRWTCSSSVDGQRLKLQLGARGRGDNDEPFPRLGWRREQLDGGWPRQADPARRRVKQSSGGMAPGRRKWETSPSASNTRMGKDHSMWGGGHRRCTVIVESPCAVSRVRRWPTRAVKRRVRVTSGARLHFVILKIFIHLKIEIRIGDLSDVQNSPNFAGR